VALDPWRRMTMPFPPPLTSMPGKFVIDVQRMQAAWMWRDVLMAWPERRLTAPRRRSIVSRQWLGGHTRTVDLPSSSLEEELMVEPEP
jgi:hypothetical protein